MKQKNTITLILMISSIALLVVLQFLWIQNSYEKAFFDFRRDTNMLFRGTIVSMRDSLFDIQTISSTDTNKFSFQTRSDNLADSIRARVQPGAKSESVQIFLSSTSEDSITQDKLKPLVSRIQTMRVDGRSGAQRTFVVRLSPDSLNHDSIASNFRRVLKRAGIHAPFIVRRHTIHHLQDELPVFAPPFDSHDRGQQHLHDNIYRDTITSEMIRLNPITRYTVSMLNVRGLLLREISLQLLFSIFLTSITIGAFLVMYRSIRSQQRLMELKNDFISNVTHELKTPVATVSVALEALRNFQAIDNPALTKEYLDIAQNELNRLTMMTDKILKTSIYESHGVSLHKTTVNLETLATEVVDAMRLLLTKQKATVTITKEGHDVTLAGDELHLTNVISNLLDNALKYSGENAIINIHLQETNDKLIFSIRDNGPGIAPEYQKKVFEKFFRVPTGNIHNTKGYGLGLSYVHSVVESHGGKIHVESEPGKGSLFIIVLPK